MWKCKTLLFLICICIIIPISIAETVEDTAIITMTDTNVIYQIDYGNSLSNNVSLTSYQLSTNIDLNAMQSWNIYGSNDGSNWTLLDSRSNISFSSGIAQAFTISTPAVNRYYNLYLKNGFYSKGNLITLTLITNQNTSNPPTSVTISEPHPLVQTDLSITMTNTSVLYNINYGNNAANIRLISYNVVSVIDLTNVQSWDIFGSNDERVWSLIDSQTNISFTHDIPNSYSPLTIKQYKYYIIYLNGGPYNIDNKVMFTLIIDENGNGNLISASTNNPILYPAQVEGNQSSRITAEIGETYVKWSWTYNNAPEPVNIYVNDTNIPIEVGYNMTSYLVPGLQPGEKHNIAIYTTNGTQLVGRAVATTTAQSETIYIMLGLCFVIMIIAFMLNDLTKFLLISIFNIILCIFGADLASGHGMLPYVFFGIAILTGIILLIQGLPKLREEIDWL